MLEMRGENGNTNKNIGGNMNSAESAVWEVLISNEGKWITAEKIGKNMPPDIGPLEMAI